MFALAALSLFLVISSGLSRPGKDGPNVRPEYLDHLLETEQYELFAEVMNIPDVSLVRPKEGERNENPMLNKDLEMGDILPAFGPLKEESRHMIKFERYGGSKWQRGIIPYSIKTSDFSQSQLNVINRAINSWNSVIGCLKWRPYNGEPDYVYIFNGNGCWSYLGRIGGQQGLSLQRNGCVWHSTVLHECAHAAGYSHEQNRWDRDDYIEMQWDNIPEEWKSQYEMTNSRDFNIDGPYDYYSVMHYEKKAPGTNKDAFLVKRSGIDENRIGKGNDFTETDVNKIQKAYC